ncbi:MAG TPA: methionyl-tRNA formyltransferase [Bacteroidia bacterium]|nr:methionyl-tRNA formyltransferase [Bacteroidia bacterium]
MPENKFKIVFLGTPEFAVPSLEILLKNNYEIAGVVTAPDQPSGRGLQVTPSPVKKFAHQHNLKIFQPGKLKDEKFLSEIKNLNADLFIVVAFRMMPKELWKMPRLGTFNLHASLLPQYRGAAPINRAIMNGEKETGVTTFFLKHEVDTGNILFREKISIRENETAGELHDKLKLIGAELVLKTVKAIEANNFKEVPQSELAEENEQLKTAPKIFKEDGKINWNQNVEVIHNQIRGLSPYPGAFTEIISPDQQTYLVKIFNCEKEISSILFSPGKIETDGKTFLKIAGTNGFIKILELQLQGKKKLFAEEFLRGFKISNGWTVAKP